MCRRRRGEDIRKADVSGGRISFITWGTTQALARLYTPPSIHTIVTMVKCPEVVEQLATENKIPLTLESLREKMKAEVQKTSDYILVTLDWSDRSQVDDLAGRWMELAIEKYNRQRQEMAKEALEKLDANLKKVKEDEAGQD